MALTNGDITNLKNADQRFTAAIAIFPEVTLTTTAPNPGAGSPIALKPMPLVSPRYSVLAYSATITLYGRDSYNRGVSYVGDANISWVNTGGAGTLIDNGDGTADYTAPASGTGPNLITMTATNGNGSTDARVQVQYPKTTHDENIGEIGGVQASIGSHGWTMTMRIRGDASDFTVGKGVLLDVVDSWDGAESTFGGYKYPEGNFYGYIVDTSYFEDWSGDRWLAVKMMSSWHLLERYEIGETYWGKTAATGRYYIADFRPVDALHKIFTDIVDYSKYHNVTLFTDDNIIDDFIIGKGTEQETNLATITADIMARGLAIAITDRYSSLLCVPDPDVRASEWWGTPAPVYTGSEILNEDLAMNYAIATKEVPAIKKLTLEAYNSNRLGIWARSEGSAGTRGSNSNIRGLLCDDTLKLVSWATDKRAQMNRDWSVRVGLPLNHTVDLLNFVDIDFTNPAQVGAPTASGRGWVSEINYRPASDGSWLGSWSILRHMEGVTAAGDTSGWGGSGEAGGTVSPSGFEVGEGTGGWATATGGGDGWAFLFDFTDNSGSGFFSATTGQSPYSAAGGAAGAYVAETGWASVSSNLGGNNQMYHHIKLTFDWRDLTGSITWASSQSGYGWAIYNADGNIRGDLWYGAVSHPTGANVASTIIPTSTNSFIYRGNGGNGQYGTGFIVSAVVAGRGVSPFPGSPTGNY